MRSRILVTLVAALLLALPARAERLTGVWVGTLGPAKVSVCFEPDGRAAYYYAKRGVDIPLRNKGAVRWDEEGERGKITGTWTIQLGSKGMLSGQWTSPDGKRVLPIALDTMTEESGPSFCRSRGYRALHAATTAAANQALPDLQLETANLMGPALQSLQVVGDATEHAPVRKVLGALNSKLVREYEECMDIEGKRSAYFEVDVDWVFTSPHLLVLTVHKQYFCGGAHPDSNFVPVVVDRATGKDVDMATWLTISPDDLGRENWKPKGKRCADVRVDGESFAVWPTLEGIALRPLFAQVNAGCARNGVLPYARLRDKLTPAGKRAVAEISQVK